MATNRAARKSVAVDAGGNAYLTGYTYSSDFPTMNPLQATLGDGGYIDAFAVKVCCGTNSGLPDGPVAFVVARATGVATQAAAEAYYDRYAVAEADHAASLLPARATGSRNRSTCSPRS